MKNRRWGSKNFRLEYIVANKRKSVIFLRIKFGQVTEKNFWDEVSSFKVTIVSSYYCINRSITKHYPCSVFLKQSWAWSCNLFQYSEKKYYFMIIIKHNLPSQFCFFPWLNSLGYFHSCDWAMNYGFVLSEMA